MVTVKDDKLVAESVLLTPMSEPLSPEEGMTYYDSTEKKMKYYNGTKWVIVSG